MADLTSGWYEEPADAPGEESKLVIDEDGHVKEAPVDFVDAMTREPTPEQNPTEKVQHDNEGAIGHDFFDRDNQWQAAVLGELPTGKTLQVKQKKDNSGTGFYLCYREGLEKVPPQIGGWFTSYDKAEQAGRTYLNQQWDLERAKAADA